MRLIALADLAVAISRAGTVHLPLFPLPETPEHGHEKHGPYIFISTIHSMPLICQMFHTFNLRLFEDSQLHRS